MRDIDRALSDISDIRNQIAATRLFQGFGPAVIAVTAGFALIVAGLQVALPDVFANTPFRFFGVWTATALISITLIGAEMFARSHRHHEGLADSMVKNAVEQFIPAGFAGMALALVLFQFSPNAVWLLPGLWQILIALGLFSALRSLPRSVVLVPAWYLVAGLAAIIYGSAGQQATPWMMGLPFAVGQALMAVVLYFAEGGRNGNRT